MSKNSIFIDIECYRNFFYIGVKRLEDGKRKGFEFSERRDFDRAKVRAILKRNRSIGFNSLPYDLPMTYLALSGAPNDELKDASDRIIKGGIKWWEVERELGISIPKIDHIDLFEPNPAVKDSLKTLNGRLHGKRLQDLPYHESTILTHEQMDTVADYCLTSDLDATENLFNALQPALKLREDLGALFDTDFRSKSDAQFGEYIIKKRIEAITGKRPQRSEIKPGSSFKYDVPDFIEFVDPQLVFLLDKIRGMSFFIKKDGKTEKPRDFNDIDIRIGNSKYSFGIGGLHSTESRRAIHSDDDYVLIDADVGSQYPKAISKLKLYPKSVGPVFTRVYDGLIEDRLDAKRRKDKTKDKGFKIALNGGGYGKLGSPYSVLYAPHLLLATTLTCQLSVLMLISDAERQGISVVSGNTDGVIFRVPRRMYEGIEKDRLLGGKLKEVTDRWEAKTGFELEFTEYKSVYSRDVNMYMALRADGRAKRKGTIANHWHPDSPDYDPEREQLKKNPQMTICGDAALKFLLDGTPIEKTIRENGDIRGFVTVVNAAGGATWRDGYLGKVVRYYWSTDGDPIIKVKGHPTTGNRPKVPKTDGCRPCMTLPDTFPADIDFDRYISETKQILEDIGWQPIAVGASPLELIFNQLLIS